MDKIKLDKIKRQVDASIEDMIKLQIALTAIPALAPENGGNGEFEKAEYLTNYLYRLGFSDVRNFSAPDNRVASGCRPNLIATVTGKNPQRTIWILTHLDIVPPGEIALWNKEPYQGYVENGRFYGRGAEDNQQDLVSSLFAAKAFLDEAIQPENTIGLAFVADEETGSKYGLNYLLETHGDLFRKTDLIVVPDAGTEDGTKIEVAEKSMLWLRFKTSGKQCHASMPALGKNAFAAASHLVVRLSELRNIFDAVDSIFIPSSSTFEPTRKDANVPNINTIPGEDVFFLDCRILPCYALSTVLAEIRKMADEIENRFAVSIEISPVQQVEAPPPTPADAPVVLALKEAIKDIYGAEASPMGIGGGTVAAVFRKFGYPAAVWSRVGARAHQPNEYCLLENMIGNAKVYAHLFLQI
jgi:succinyl-diaminopimelate desuccinylase